MIISDSLTTSISKHLTTTGKLQYVSSMMTSTTISTGGTSVSDTSISGSEVAILSIGTDLWSHSFDYWVGHKKCWKRCDYTITTVIAVLLKD